MRSLTEITVTAMEVDGEHDQISIEAPCPADDPEAFGWPSTQEIIDAAAYVAGILGRLAFLANLELASLRENGQHHCDRSCYIGGMNETMLDLVRTSRPLPRCGSPSLPRTSTSG